MKFEAGDDKKSMTARGLTFDAILTAQVLDFISHPAHTNQMILIVKLGEYAVAVPCKPLGGDRWLMATAYHSRKFTKQYLRP